VVVRNNGHTNLDKFLAPQTTAHNAAVCASGFAASSWAKQHNIDGYVTVDIRKGKGSTEANKIPGASGRKDAKNDGYADLILWTKDRVYIWEIKPNGKAEGYGRQ
jgi:hypothetical protein